MPNTLPTDEGHVVRLRREPYAFVMWGGFVVPIIGLMLVVGIATLGDAPERIFPYLILAPTVLLGVVWISTKAVIVDGEVRERNWLRYRSIPLRQIAEIREGQVGWGQGKVRGLELVRVDGSGWFELRLSANLTPGRRDEWVRLIEQARAREK